MEVNPSQTVTFDLLTLGLVHVCSFFVVDTWSHFLFRPRMDRL